MTRSIVIVVPSLHKFDAIGMDVLLQKECLNEAGEVVALYAEQYDPSFADLLISFTILQQILADSGNLLIYHFGVYWHRLPELLKNVKSRIWIKYHNVTPPFFYAGWDEGSFHATAAGQEQARWLAQQKQPLLFLGDSQFNLDELSALARSPLLNTAVLAPFVQLLSESEPAEGRSDTKMLDSAFIHLLFVGRVVPNKAHHHLLATLQAYRQLFPTDTIQLHLAGALHPNFARYSSFLKDLAQRLGIQDNLKFWDKTSAETLKNLYRQATVFLCMSEHEGFCVPVIEAQAAGLPVLALARGAIAATLGPSQLLMTGEPDYDLAACLIKKLTSQRELRESLVLDGYKNVARYKKSQLGQELLNLIYNFA